MSDFLLELFSEEIPARMQAAAQTHVSETLSAALANKEIQAFSTPRRLAVIIQNIPEKQPDITTELKGPKVDAPAAALDGFLKKNSLTQAQLENRGGVYFATIHQKGKPTTQLLQETVQQLLQQFPWPKSMRWGSGDATWVRPLHNILCIFDDNVVPIEFAGIKANNKTFGHRFLSPQEIIISDAKQYETLLEKAFVIASRDKRKTIITQQSANIASSLGLAVLPDEKLLEEVVGLVEYPVVLLGKIDDSFMDLPPEVLTMVMRAHQKYMALSNADGSLSPYFIITSNLQSADGGAAIIEGNQRVLRARFADGRFFWDQDRKTPLAQFAEGLKSVTYHAKLGTVAQKVARIEKLVSHIAKHESLITNHESLALRAATLCKADLVSGMVGEFAELQGIMGRYYAMQQNEPQAVADAIRDHYKPQGPADSVPTAPVSIIVALADKLDTLLCMFAIGEKPTGSKDPFALRRAALGVIRIILENNLRLPLLPLFAFVPSKEIALHKAQEKLVKQTEAKLHQPDRVGKYLTVNEVASSDIPEDAASELAQELLAFFHDRLIVQLKDQGIRHDVIKAVIEGDDDLVRIVNKARALQEFLATDDGKNLLAGYKRAANILAIEEKKDKRSYNEPVDNAFLAPNAPEEANLAHALTSAFNSVKADIETEAYRNLMQTLSTLRLPVDTFFDKVMVNVEDQNIRMNRLRILASIRNIINNVADFKLIEG